MIRSSLFVILEDLLFPPRCASCGARLSVPAGTRLCLGCKDEIQAVSSPFCSICGDPFKSRAGVNRTCGRCLKALPFFEKARSFLVYSGPVRELIRRIKFHDDGHALRALKEIVEESFGRPACNGDAVVVPMPLHRARLIERGFNQSLKIALQLFPKKMINRAMLKRIRNTPSQTGLSMKDRERNVRGAFVMGHYKCPPDKVLLFDDVFTTGATVNEAAKALKRGGVKRVEVLTVARAVRW